MISNLRHQLRKVGLEHKIDQALEETMQVRAELGYPIMVTPLSQFVGSQAAINVIVGERYKEVTDQIIQYALGYWGREGAELLDPGVKEKILDRPRAREWAQWQPPEPTVAEVRKKMNAEGVSDEELLLRWNLSVEEIATMRAAGAPKEYLTARQPLVDLIDALSKRTDYRQIVIQKGKMVVSLNRGPAPAE
jgi:oxaloacetate decarboxylase alpha subunit